MADTLPLIPLVNAYTVRCPRCEQLDVKVTKVRGDSTSYRCRFCGQRFRVTFDGS